MSTTGTTGTTISAGSAASTTGTADATGTTGTTDTTGTAEELISEARAQIDDLDGRIISLIQERVAVSARIQQARITSGGRRVHLSREMEILGRFRGELGAPGTDLAMTLLELSRGRV